MGQTEIVYYLIGCNKKKTICFAMFLPKMYKLNLIDGLFCIIIGLLPSKMSRSWKLKNHGRFVPDWRRLKGLVNYMWTWFMGTICFVKKKKRDGIGSQNFKQPTRWMENWLYKGGFFDNSKQLWRQVIKFEWVLQTR